MKKNILIALLAILYLSVKAQTNKDIVDSENWKYSEDTNEMSNQKSYYAENYSKVLENEVGTKLVVRYLKGENDVLLSIGNVLFDEGVGAYEIQVKFDEGKIEKFLCTKASGNDFQTVFVY